MKPRRQAAGWGVCQAVAGSPRRRRGNGVAQPLQAASSQAGRRHVGENPLLIMKGKGRRHSVTSPGQWGLCWEVEAWRRKQGGRGQAESSGAEWQAEDRRNLAAHMCSGGRGQASLSLSLCLFSPHWWGGKEGEGSLLWSQGRRSPVGRATEEGPG